MKKIMLAVAALIAASSITLVSCGGNPADKAVSILKDGTEKMENASNSTEAKQIAADVAQKLSAIDDKDFEPTEDQLKAVKEATKAFEKAAQEKGAGF